MVIISMATNIHARGGGNEWAAFGGAFGGTMLGNAIASRGNDSSTVYVVDSNRNSNNNDADNERLNRLEAQIAKVQQDNESLRKENASLKQKNKKQNRKQEMNKKTEYSNENQEEPYEEWRERDFARH